MNTNTDYTSPSARFTFDMNNSHLFVKDNQNLINVVGKKQLNTLENNSLLDIYLSSSNIVEPHYHQNASEFIYCISGSITISILNPFSNSFMNFSLTPGQVVNVPRGWWHYIVATADNTHLLAIFDAPNPEVILGSTLLKLTPPDIMANTYCINEKEWENVIKPIEPNTFIGPSENCNNNRHIISSYSDQHYSQSQKHYY